MPKIVTEDQIPDQTVATLLATLFEKRTVIRTRAKDYRLETENSLEKRILTNYKNQSINLTPNRSGGTVGV